MDGNLNRRHAEKALFLCGLVILVLVAFLAVFGRALGQKEDHAAVLSGAVQLVFMGRTLVPVNSDTYLVRTKDRLVPLHEHLSQENWVYVDQLGSTLIFEKEGKKLTAEVRHYTRLFQLADITAP